MIDKIDTSQIQDIVGKLPSKQADLPKAPIDNNADASLQADYASLISRATQIPEVDTEIIRKAQELLQSGQLESPENIREAAENIIRNGV
jgi:hypothetical protein